MKSAFRTRVARQLVAAQENLAKARLNLLTAQVEASRRDDRIVNTTSNLSAGVEEIERDVALLARDNAQAQLEEVGDTSDTGNK